MRRTSRAPTFVSENRMTILDASLQNVGLSDNFFLDTEYMV